MPSSLKLTCLDCGAVNRVPAEKLGAGPKCGTCGARLNDGKVREVDASVLARAARADDVPLLVDFWAPWCGPCRTMAPEFVKAAAALAPGVRLAKLNTEDFPKPAAKHNIRSIPTMVLFEGGREIARQSGAIPATAIAAFVRERAKRAGLSA